MDDGLDQVLADRVLVTLRQREAGGDFFLTCRVVDAAVIHD